MPIVKDCEHCGNAFSSKASRGRRWCSVACHVAWGRQDGLPPEPVDGARWIPACHGRFALVDDADFKAASRWSWAAVIEPSGRVKCVYGAHQGKHVLLHALVFGSVGVDHANGDTLDNRRANLRAATAQQNARNCAKKRGASVYKGVTKGQRPGTWKATIKIGGITKTFPQRTAEEDAARDYDDAAREHFGAFACVNFPRSGERSASAIVVRDADVAARERFIQAGLASVRPATIVCAGCPAVVRVAKVGFVPTWCAKCSRLGRARRLYAGGHEPLDAAHEQSAAELRRAYLSATMALDRAR